MVFEYLLIFNPVFETNCHKKDVMILNLILRLPSLESRLARYPLGCNGFYVLVFRHFGLVKTL